MATVRIQVRRGTATDWSTVNPTLAAGELGIETNTRKLKVGDGSTAWNSLEYIASDAPGIAEISQDAINTALSMGSGLTKTYDDGANTITLSINSNVVALKSYVDSEITATENYADSAISTHNSDTTNVHGITNTADLATQNYVDSAVASLGNSVDNTYIPDSEKGQPGGVANLNSYGKVPNTLIDDETFARVTYVDNAAATAVANLVDDAPTMLNTLNELSAAINDDPAYAATITTALAGKVNKNGDTLTGFIFTANPTEGGHLANKQYVDGIHNSLTVYIDQQDQAITTNIGQDISNIQGDISLIQGDIVGLQSYDQLSNSTFQNINQSLSDINTEILTNLPAEITTQKNNAISIANSYTDSEISDEVSARNIAISNAVSDHNDETLNVHGILNTANLATKTYADNSASSAVSTHEADTTNIHGITDTTKLVTTDGTQTLTNKTITSPSGLVKADVGLGNVNNTSDANKPVSTATQSALDLKADLAGPTFTGTVTLPSTTSIGNVSATELGYVDGVTSAIQTQLDAKLASATAASTYAPIASPTFTGTVSGVTKSMVGLGNVDNTSDANKPISTATQTALDLKAPLASPTFTGTVTLPTGTVTSGMILDGTIVNADINASAAIAATKVAGTAVTQADTGTVTSTMIANGTIVNGNISSSAAIALSKLATDPLARANHTGTQAASTISDFDTQVRTSKVTDLTAPTGSFSMNSQKITNLATPTSDNDAANKSYVDAAVNNVNIHESVVAATTANVNLTNAVDNNKVLDGVTLSTGNRILVKNQNTASQNGIYIVAANGAPTRATDYDAAGEVSSGDFVFVSGGTVNGNTGWIQTAVVTTVGTDALSFTQFSGAGTYTASTGLSLSGTAFAIDSTVVTLTGTQTLTNKTLTSPTLTAPVLGTPASGTLTNATGLPISTGVSGLGTGVATALAVNVGSAGAPVVNGGVLGTPSSGTLTNATGLPLTTGVTGTLPVANGGTGATASTGTGNVVLATSPTLVTPTIGAATATSVNGTTIPTSKTLVVTTDKLSVHAATTSAELAGVISDETGTGALVFANSPTLITPALGTPASGVLTNATGLPLTTGVTGTLPVANGGTGATASTGTGNVVLATSPTLVTPVLGAASATSIAFSDGTQSKQGVPSLTAINAQIGTTYTTVLTDRDSLVECNNASAITVTIPLNSAVAYPVGTSIDILQTGAGQVTINGTAGVTINATPQGTANTAKLRAQWSSATLFKRATDTWVITGDLTA